MNCSVKEIAGEILVVSQFTLFGNCLNGCRPDFLQAAPSAMAQPLYDQFIKSLKQDMPTTQAGVFGANMQIALINDGPVTLLIDSDKKNF
jgi:D-aminoacyl-tRNA deacylase